MDRGRNGRRGVGALLPIFRAGAVFVVIMVAFYFVETTEFFQQSAFPAYLHFNADVSAHVLRVFGEDASATGTSVSSPAFALEVRRGCDAVEPSALFIAAVIALPVFFWKRLAGIVVGTLILALVNLVRIITLYYVGAYWPAAFHVMHVDVWQGIFILLVIVLWALWAQWARADAKKAEHAGG